MNKKSQHIHQISPTAFRKNKFPEKMGIRNLKCELQEDVNPFVHSDTMFRRILHNISTAVARLMTTFSTPSQILITCFW